jgi:hypothetical protein
LYNTFGDVYQFMQTFEGAVRPQAQETQGQHGHSGEVEVEARL